MAKKVPDTFFANSCLPASTSTSGASTGDSTLHGGRGNGVYGIVGSLHTDSLERSERTKRFQEPFFAIEVNSARKGS
jgi:hypothetical protein